MAFLLDILEVPESHTGMALAKAFQKMLETFGLEMQVSLQSNIMLSNLSSLEVLAMNADNATSNNTQGEALAEMPNSFELQNRVHCFNHTLQLSAKTLLHPFNTGLSKVTEDDDCNDEDLLDPAVDDNEDDDKDENDEEHEDDNLPIGADEDVLDDGIYKLDALDADSHEEIMADTAAVCETVMKVCFFY